MGYKKRIMGLMLAAVLLIGSLGSVNATDVQEAKDKEQQIEEEKKQTEAEKQSLAEKVKALSDSMKEAEQELEEKQAEIERVEQELIMTKMDENEQYESMKLRIKYMYENGNVNIIEIFLESESISDFLNKTEYISKLSEYDRDKLDEFQNTVRRVKEKELELQHEYDEIIVLQEKLASQRTEAEAFLQQKTSELAELEVELKEVREQIKKAEEEEKKRKEAEEAKRRQEEEKRRQEEEKRRQEEEAEKEQNSSQDKPDNNDVKPPIVSGSGYFTHPCPGMSYQSSYFGEIRHGIGDLRPHQGHDYAASEGTPIYAAADGRVLIAGYSYSAGYWVVIDHGNGLTTKYMHMFEHPYVSAGEKVVKGQHIGGVGTTGQSTGNHLHFQVEEDGVAVNPSKYM